MTGMNLTDEQAPKHLPHCYGDQRLHCSCPDFKHSRASWKAIKEMEARKDAAYLERNQVVAALAKCFPSGVARTAIEGWSEDWHGCVYIDLPTGQASWHFHDSHAHLFAGLPAYAGSWDGHTTEEKYARLARLSQPVPAEPGKLPEDLTEIKRWLVRLDNPGATWTHERVASELKQAVEYVGWLSRAVKALLAENARLRSEKAVAKAMSRFHKRRAQLKAEAKAAEPRPALPTRENIARLYHDTAHPEACDWESAGDEFIAEAEAFADAILALLQPDAGEKTGGEWKPDRKTIEVMASAFNKAFPELALEVTQRWNTLQSEQEKAFADLMEILMEAPLKREVP